METSIGGAVMGGNGYSPDKSPDRNRNGPKNKNRASAREPRRGGHQPALCASIVIETDRDSVAMSQKEVGRELRLTRAGLAMTERRALRNCGDLGPGIAELLPWTN